MNEKIIIADNFYDIALRYHKSFFEKKCLITEETEIKVKKLLNNENISISYASNEVEGFDVRDQITANFKFDWIGVIYMTLPPSCVSKQGLSFYKHKKTGLYNFPNSFENKNFEKMSIEDMEKKFDINDISQWEKYFNIYIKYNRIVLFQSNYWHSYGNGFGTTFDTSMMYQKLLIKNN